MHIFIRLSLVFWVLSTSILSYGCVAPPMDSLTRPAVQDETLASGEPCLPPCWYGIIPEETSAQDAMSIIMELPFVNPGSVGKTTKDLYANTDNSILWYYVGSSNLGGRLFIRDGTIVWWRVSYPKFLRLVDIVSIIGEPDWVWAGRAGGGEVIAHVYRFYFQRSGLLLESRMYGVDMRQDSNVLLSPEIEISRSRYFRPQPIERYLVNIVGASEEQSERIKKLYRPWPGFDEWIEMQSEY